MFRLGLKRVQTNVVPSRRAESLQAVATTESGRKKGGLTKEKVEGERWERGWKEERWEEEREGEKEREDFEREQHWRFRGNNGHCRETAELQLLDNHNTCTCVGVVLACL